MSARIGRVAVGMAASACAVLTASLILPPPRPWIVWNASASAPLGAYRIRGDVPIVVGDYAAIAPSAPLGAYLAKRRYLPMGLPLIKRVAALGGARVCRRGGVVSVDGKAMAHAAMRDRAGRALPVWSGCRRLHADEIFVLNAAPASFDSRYFGPLHRRDLLGRADPLLTRGAPLAPLRWRGLRSEPAVPLQTKG